ncbi:MAG: leucine-rich repeat domain-containing protein [Candidatus Symbiothrix sp.]|jgi:hypothetical protein|nr:leucine-rich repeat domain-containing protein [Candidatus Symbiothrix sp.]
MKTKLTFKSLLVIIGLLLTFSAQAQDVPPITINVATAGTLPNLIAETKKYMITDLTLTGNLNGTDIKFIREMAGRDVNGNGTSGKLAILNLADANIVSGGQVYYSFYTTSNNAIGDYAFYLCTRLTSVTIPNSVTSIGQRAFYYCIGLTSMTIPNSVTSIKQWAFEDCTGIKEFIVSEQNTHYSAIDGVLYNKDKTTLIYCPNAKAITTYIIPNSVTLIGGYAFANCTGLTSVTIGNSVTLIGGYAFSGCKGLTSVTIGNSVKSIGDSAFENCTGLTSVTIPNCVTSIGDRAFEGCTGIKEIHMKNPTPPSGGYSFSVSVDKKICKLYVPKGSYMAYWIAVGWGDFVNIIEEDATAINTINKDKIAINSNANGIVLATKEATSVSVFNIAGQKAYQSVINGCAEISLNKGVYVVRVDNESQKVVVK